MIEQKIEGAKERGKREVMIMLLTGKIGSISDLLKQINQANIEQLNKLFKHFSQMNSEEDILLAINHTFIDKQ